MTDSSSKSLVLVAMVAVASTLIGPADSWASCTLEARVTDCSDGRNPDAPQHVDLSVFSTIVDDVKRRIADSNSAAGIARENAALPSSDNETLGVTGHVVSDKPAITGRVLEIGVPAAVSSETDVLSSPAGEIHVANEEYIANAIGTEAPKDTDVASTADLNKAAEDGPDEEVEGPRTFAEQLGLVHRASKRSGANGTTITSAKPLEPVPATSTSSAEREANHGARNGRTIAESIKSTSDEPPLDAAPMGEF